jgi:tryptophan halogenase
VEPFTSSIAMLSGWTWKIPMLSRFGTGYVYSSKFATPDEAVDELSRLWDLPAGTEFNKIRFRVGRNRRSWVKNCVSIGLASCFLEPLESTGIYFTYAAIYQLAKHFPDLRFDQIMIDRFNHEIAQTFDDTRDFIQAHFYFSPRVDTPFWRANKELVLTDQIREKVAMFRAGVPINPPLSGESEYYGNFEAEFRNFWTNGSYYCIFAGLGVERDHSLPMLTHKPESLRASERIFAQVKERQNELLKPLPPTYQYLQMLHGKN